MKRKEHNVDFIEGGLGLVGPSHLIWLTKPKELVFRNYETEMTLDKKCNKSLKMCKLLKLGKNTTQRCKLQ